MRCARQAATVPNLRQGGHEELKETLEKQLIKLVQNRPRNYENSGPRGCPGALWRPSGWSWALLEVSGAIFWRFSAKMGPRWTEDGPSRQQVAPKMDHDSPQKGHVELSLGAFGGSWVTFLWIFGKMAEV